LLAALGGADDHRHRLVANDTYALPWRMRGSGIVTLESGPPFTVNRTPERWFDTLVFSLPAPFTFGTAGRNIVYGPGYANVDAVLQKDARLSGRVGLELRWEVFNLLDRTNFNIPGRIAFTPNFGRIFSALPARQMQCGARLTF
jgi:hypothetical protein